MLRWCGRLHAVANTMSASVYSYAATGPRYPGHVGKAAPTSSSNFSTSSSAYGSGVSTGGGYPRRYGGGVGTNLMPSEPAARSRSTTGVRGNATSASSTVGVGRDYGGYASSAAAASRSSGLAIEHHHMPASMSKGLPVRVSSRTMPTGPAHSPIRTSPLSHVGGSVHSGISQQSTAFLQRLVNQQAGSSAAHSLTTTSALNRAKAEAALAPLNRQQSIDRLQESMSSQQPSSSSFYLGSARGARTNYAGTVKRTEVDSYLAASNSSLRSRSEAGAAPVVAIHPSAAPLTASTFSDSYSSGSLPPVAVGFTHAAPTINTSVAPLSGPSSATSIGKGGSVSGASTPSRIMAILSGFFRPNSSNNTAAAAAKGSSALVGTAQKLSDAEQRDFLSGSSGGDVTAPSTNIPMRRTLSVQQQQVVPVTIAASTGPVRSQVVPSQQQQQVPTLPLGRNKGATEATGAAAASTSSLSGRRSVSVTPRQQAAIDNLHSGWASQSGAAVTSASIAHAANASQIPRGRSFSGASSVAVGSVTAGGGGRGSPMTSGLQLRQLSSSPTLQQSNSFSSSSASSSSQSDGDDSGHKQKAASVSHQPADHISPAKRSISEPVAIADHELPSSSRLQHLMQAEEEGLKGGSISYISSNSSHRSSSDGVHHSSGGAERHQHQHHPHQSAQQQHTASPSMAAVQVSSDDDPPIRPAQAQVQAQTGIRSPQATAFSTGEPSRPAYSAASAGRLARIAVPLPPGPPLLPAAATSTASKASASTRSIEPVTPPKQQQHTATALSSSSAAWSDSSHDPRAKADSDDDTEYSGGDDHGDSYGSDGEGRGAGAMPSRNSSSSRSSSSSVAAPSRLFSSPSSSLYASSPRGVVGLSNLGNTCYMNSTLQCLSNIPKLRSYYAGGEFEADLNTERSPTKGEVAVAFSQLMRQMWTSGAMVVTPSEFKRVVSRLGGNRFAGYAQHDSHELLRLLVEALGDDTNRVRGKPPYRELDAPPGKSDAEISADWWEYYNLRHQSLPWQLFAGQLKTSVVCSSCGTTHRAFDPFQDLQLPLSSNGSSSSGGVMSMFTGGRGEAVPLQRCLQEFGAEERLSGENAYYCSKCKVHTTCTKTMELFRLPPVLVLQLKRFGGSSWRRTKVSTPVSFPVTGLDLRPFCAQQAPGLTSRDSSLYDLIAVSCHSGDLGFGHYFAYARNCDCGRWFTFNDSSVSENAIEQHSGGSSSAYVLVYIRRDA